MLRVEWCWMVIPFSTTFVSQDCGEWGDAGSNFTDTSVYVSNSWFDDDDWEMMANDDALLYGQEMNAQPLYKRNWNDHHAIHKVCWQCLLHDLNLCHRRVKRSISFGRNVSALMSFEVQLISLVREMEASRVNVVRVYIT